MPSAGATSTAASDSADGSGRSPAVGSVSIAMIGVPTSIVSPSPWKIRATLPAHFAGISTAALAVSTSTIGWFNVIMSPSATSHLRISPSVRPSPRSGSGNSLTLLIGLPPERSVDGVEHAVQVGQELLLGPGGRVGDVEPGHPQHRGLERVEAGLGHPGRDLATQATAAGGLVHDDQATGTPHRRVHRVEVQRRQRAQVDHLELAPL